MARPNKEGLDYCPLWKPQWITERRFHSNDFKVRLKAIRNSSSGFIKKAEVRRIIFERDNFRCLQCGSTEDLQVDHIVSVYQAAKGIIPIENLNTRENLQTLCKQCNSGKRV